MWIPDLQLSAGALVGSAMAAIIALPVEAADGYALGRCLTAKPSSGASIRPTYAADTYLFTYLEKANKDLLGRKFDFSGAKVTLVKAPKHGKVVYSDMPRAEAMQYYHYWPKDDGYTGNDRFVMQVEKDGVKVRIHYLIKSIDENEAETVRGDFGRRSIHCNPEQWKISYFPTTPNEEPLSTLLPRVIQSLTGFTDLAGSSVGQTTGTAAKITLDANAAGHGWYLDYTPYLNEETSPPAPPTKYSGTAHG